MDPRHPESEAPEPGAVPRESGGISARIAQYCDHTVFDPDRTIDALMARETADTLRPPGEDSDRGTLPPGSDPIDDPAHLSLVGTIESGLDKRFADIMASVLEKVSAVHVELRSLRTEINAYARHMELLQRSAERAADAMTELVTRVEQLADRLDRSEHICALRHGNGSTIPQVIE